MITFFYVFAAILLTLLVFRTARILLMKKKSTQRYMPVASAVELALWIVITFWIIHLFFSHLTLYHYIVTALALAFSGLIGWFYVKDIIAGFIFSIRHNPIRGQTLKSNQIQGTIRKIGLSQVTIESINGQLQRVPYSALVTQTLSLHTKHESAPGEAIIKLKVSTEIDPIRFEQRVRETLALSSWCIASKPIVVQPDPVQLDTFNVSFFLLNPSYRSLALERLNKLTEEFNITNDY